MQNVESETWIETRIHQAVKINPERALLNPTQGKHWKCAFHTAYEETANTVRNRTAACNLLVVACQQPVVRENVTGTLDCHEENCVHLQRTPPRKGEKFKSDWTRKCAKKRCKTTQNDCQLTANYAATLLRSKNTVSPKLSKSLPRRIKT